MFILSCPLQIAFLFSLGFAVADIRSRTVSAGLFAAYFIAGTVLACYSERELTDILFCALPGFLLLILSFLSGGGIGTGDALFFILSSLYLNLSRILFVFSVSFLTAGIMSLFLIIRRKTKPLPYLAFIPLPLFLLVFTGAV